MLEKYGTDISRCPKWEKGTMMLMETVPPYYDCRIKQTGSVTVSNDQNHFALTEGCEVGVAVYFLIKLLQTVIAILWVRESVLHYP
jgi:hypothetical protein